MFPVQFKSPTEPESVIVHKGLVPSWITIVPPSASKTLLVVSFKYTLLSYPAPIAVADAPEGEKVCVKEPAPSSKLKPIPAAIETVVSSSETLEEVICPDVEVNLVKAFVVWLVK